MIATAALANTPIPEVICYGQVGNGHWQQESYETASKHARIRAAHLRKLGYQVVVSSLGTQVTGVGLVKMTMVGIYRGCHSDLSGLPPVRVERI